jgi:hypothetical protein
MVPCLLKRADGMIAGYACPVPGCGRMLVGNSFVGGKDPELVLAAGAGAGASNSLKASGATNNSSKKKKNASNQDRPLNRQAAARAAILKAIEEKQRT